MTRISINGIHLNVEVRGTGDPFLLLHGFMGSTATWKYLGPEITENYKLICIDLHGHGQSDSPENTDRYYMDKVTQDVTAVLNYYGIESANVLGYSMGGRVALNLAVTEPQRVHTLILESASPGITELVERQARIENDDAAAMRLEREGLAAFVEYWTNLPLFASQRLLPPEVRANIYSQRLQNTVAGLAGALRGLSPGIQSSRWGNLADLKMPVLLVMGALDEKYVKIGQQMAEKIPDVTLRIVPNAGHTVHIEQPEVFTGLVCEYLAQHNRLDHHTN